MPHLVLSLGAEQASVHSLSLLILPAKEQDSGKTLSAGRSWLKVEENKREKVPHCPKLDHRLQS